MSAILDTCDISMAEIARNVGLSPSTIYAHKAWLEGKEWGREFKGTYVSPATKRRITMLAKKCIRDYDYELEAPYREKVGGTEDVIKDVAEEVDVFVPKKEVLIPSRYVGWRAELVWTSKHGGRDRQEYTEEFTASVEFSLPRKYGHDDAVEVAERLFNRALPKAGTGYPDVDVISHNWGRSAPRSPKTAIGVRRLDSPPLATMFQIEKTGGDSTGYKTVEPFTIDVDGENVL